ncbi:hypothetical protein K4A83_03330 [Spirulina subsalsa FACHB-351]|uniref:Uncharacterized protein n=1 Tax=Spirulina subsalsa FACHB-351 TaxID=234711 RepID=A0ABT3L296_9CYAN|nr:hypothetical protein [Spirulina subsalsa]MCW6035307.1 hypothetical protein [Spirulina subsalsa FACHB-351]
MVQAQEKITYDFTVDILSGSLKGRQFTGFFTYDSSALQGEEEETIKAEEVEFNYLSQYRRENPGPNLIFKRGNFQRMVWVDGKQTERFGFNGGFNRRQFCRASEVFIREGKDYFGYLDRYTYVDGAGVITYVKRDSVLLGDRKNPESGDHPGDSTTVTEIPSAVLLRCEKISGKLRIRVISEGYNRDVNVQFPRSIREVGALYVVDEVELSSNGKFYRTVGQIRRLVLPEDITTDH